MLLSSLNQSIPESPLITHVIYSGLGGHSAVLIALLKSPGFATYNHYVIFAGVERPNPFTISEITSFGYSYSYVSRHNSLFSYLSFVHQVAIKIKSSSSSITFFHGLSCVPASLWLRSPSIVRDTQNQELKSPVDWLLLLLANLFCSRLVFLTPLSATSARQKLKIFFRTNKVCIIPNPVDSKMFKPKKFQPIAVTSNVPINLGMVSRLQPIKDHKTLLEGLYLLTKLDPSRQYVLHIAGDGPTRQDIHNYINSYSLSDQVIMYGLLSPSEVSRLLQSLDIYIHLTEGETMSNSILQAMATSLPIIATDVSGVNNLLTYQEAVLIPPRCADALVAAIIKLVENPSFSSRLASNSFSKVQSINSPESVSRLYLNIFDQIL